MTSATVGMANATVGMAKLAGPTPPSVRNAVSPAQVVVPQLRRRQVLVSVAPAVTVVPSGTVTSATKASQSCRPTTLMSTRNELSA